MALSTDIGIDLGTSSVLVYIIGRGVVLCEPSVVAMEHPTHRLLAVGTEAQKMLGRTPGNIVAVKPLKAGVIADFEITEIMLKHYITMVGERRRLFRPRITVCIPAGITSVEKKAVIDAVTQAGARETYLIEEPRSAALGAELDIFNPGGSMVVDIGGGTTDIAVLSMGEIVEGTSVRVGGEKFDEAITRYVKRELNLFIGERSAENIKINIGSVRCDGHNQHMEIRGRDLVTGLPRSQIITTHQVAKALSEPVSAILQGIKQVFGRTPPELAGDVMEKGVVLSGGGGLLDGLTSYLSKETGVPFYLAEDPISCVAKGTAKVFKYMPQLSSSLDSNRKIASIL
ncbi:MAG TPA: rod shape-determining protein MreB [Firmicutes bacterium]|nr:rod shape-determining protein MreB [Bacillota bacterium]